MGVSRLLAKVWVLTCLFAGAHGLRLAMQSGAAVWWPLPVAVTLFAAMGLLFIGGYSLSRDAFHCRAIARLKEGRPARTMPLFNDLVFVLFVVLSFIDQVWIAPGHLAGPVGAAVERAVYFAVPGHAILADKLQLCAIDGGGAFASAVAWLLAAVFAASTISRLKETAVAIRIDRMLHPQSLGPVGLAVVLGVTALIAIQGLFLGTALRLMPCGAFTGLSGSLLTGLAPLMFAYLVFAALAALMAGGDKS